MKERAIKAITFTLLTMVVLSALFSLTFPAEAQTLYERFRNILVSGNAVFENHVRIEVPTAQATSTPGLIIQGYGLGNPLEVRNSSGTPVYSVNSSGVSTGAGGVTNNSNLVVSAPTAIGTATPAALINNAGVSVLIDVQDGGSSVLKALNGGGVQVAAPTAIATGVPALQVNSSGGLSNLFEVRDSATPVFAVNDGGSWTSTGAGTHSSGQTVNNWAKVAAPTAIATSTPAMVVDSLGVSTILEVRDAATPVFTVLNGGNVTGKVLRYATAGTQIVCGTQTITDTADVSHGLTTPAYGMCSLNQTLAGDAYGCNATVSGITVTVKVRNNAATPVANAAGASVNWCVIGTP